MRKQRSITKDGSDKNIPRRSGILLPTEIDEILPVRELAQLGRDNLERLHAIIRQAEQVVTLFYGPTVRYPDSSPLALYNTKKEGVAILLRHYLSIIEDAQKKATYSLPFLPDLRPADWVTTGERVIVYLISVSDTRRLRPYKAEVDDNIRTDETRLFGGQIYDLRLRLLNPGWELNPTTKDFCEPVEYDLRSQYVLKVKEARYLRYHPDKLQIWLNYCGGIDPEWGLNYEMKSAWVRRFGGQRKDFKR